MMYVYVIWNENRDLYVGITNSPGRRLRQHNKGKCKTTRVIGGKWRFVRKWGIGSYLKAALFERLLHEKDREYVLEIAHKHCEWDAYIEDLISDLVPSEKDLFLQKRYENGEDTDFRRFKGEDYSHLWYKGHIASQAG